MHFLAGGPWAVGKPGTWLLVALQTDKPAGFRVTGPGGPTEARGAGGGALPCAAPIGRVPGTKGHSGPAVQNK